MVLERAAEALTVGRLLEGDASSVELEAQTKLLRDLLEGAVTDEGSSRARAFALGLGAAPAHLPVALRIAGQAKLQVVLSAVRSAGVLRGLLWTLRDHPYIQQFVESQLAPLLVLPAARRTDHLAVLRTFLGAGSMTAFAEAMHLSRAAAYGRLRTVERALGARLSDPETRVGIHLAVLGLNHREAGDPGRGAGRPDGWLLTAPMSAASGYDTAANG